MTENPEEQGIKKFVNVYSVNHVEVADSLADAMLDGRIDPIETHLALKKMEHIQKAFSKDKEAKECIRKAIERHLEGNVKTVTMHRAKMSIAPTYTWYDYSETGDIYLEQLEKIEADIKELVKARKAYLNSLIPSERVLKVFKHTEVIQQLPVLEWVECGEEISLNYPIKYQTIGVKTSFLK